MNGAGQDAAIDAHAGVGGLRRGVLSLAEVAGQSVATVAPSAAASSVVPAVLASSGMDAWLCFAVAALVCLLVARQLRAFSGRLTSPGALYAFVTDGVGPRAGAICGWSLVLAYVLAAGAALAATALYAGLCLDSVLPGAALPLPALAAGLGLLAWALARRDIRLSARATLLTEVATVALVAAAAVGALAAAGARPGGLDALVPALRPDGIAAGFALAFFGFTGFESAATLGTEARDPGRAVPRSMSSGILLAAGLFMATAAAMACAGPGASATLDGLADAAGLPALRPALTLGVTLSGFACVLASLNAGARVLLAMAGAGLLHPALGRTHPVHRTPHTALLPAAACALVPPLALLLAGMEPLAAFDALGGIAVPGFLLAYALATIAALADRRRRIGLAPGRAAEGAATLLLLLLALASACMPEVAGTLPWPALAFLTLLGVAGAHALYRLGRFARRKDTAL